MLINIQLDFNRMFTIVWGGDRDEVRVMRTGMRPSRQSFSTLITSRI